MLKVKFLRLSLVLLSCGLLLYTLSTHQAFAAESACASAKSQCKEAYEKAETDEGLKSIMAAAGDSASNVKDSASQCALANADHAAKLGGLKQACEKEDCKQDANCKQCNQEIIGKLNASIQIANGGAQQCNDIAQTVNSNSGSGAPAGGGGGGGMGGGMGDMMMPLLAGGAGFLMGQQMEKKKTDELKEENKELKKELEELKNGVNGPVDEQTLQCLKKYSSSSSSSSSSSASSTSTTPPLSAQECELKLADFCQRNATRQDCKNFALSYCGGSSETTAGSPISATTASSSNVSTPYCRYLSASKFCEASSNQTCPTCLELKTRNSPACLNATDPNMISMCNQTNISTDVISQQKLSCPLDPKWADPQYANIGSPTANSSGGGNGAGGLGSAGPTVGTTGSASGSGGTSLGSSNSATPTGSATAAAGSGSRLPAGVGSAYGPGLFKMMTNAYETQCQSNQINNCGALRGTGGGAGAE